MSFYELFPVSPDSTDSEIEIGNSLRTPVPASTPAPASFPIETQTQASNTDLSNLFSDADSDEKDQTPGPAGVPDVTDGLARRLDFSSSLDPTANATSTAGEYPGSSNGSSNIAGSTSAGHTPSAGYSPGTSAISGYTSAGSITSAGSGSIAGSSGYSNSGGSSTSAGNSTSTGSNPISKRKGPGRPVSSFSRENTARRERDRRIRRGDEHKKVVGRPRALVDNRTNERRRRNQFVVKAATHKLAYIEANNILMNSRVGKEMFPHEHKETKEAKVYQDAGKGAMALAKESGAGMKQWQFTFMLKEVGDLDTFAALTGCSKKSLKKMKKQAETMPLPAHFALKTVRIYSDGLSPETTYNIQEEIVTRFFKAHTAVFSGARSHTRQLAKGVETLMIYFYAEYPGYCRDVAALWPNLVKEIRDKAANGSKLTILQSNLLFSIDVAALEGFDEKQEFLRRFNDRMDLYKRKILETRICRRFKITIAEARAACSALFVSDDPPACDEKQFIHTIGVMDDLETPALPTIDSDDPNSTQALQRRIEPRLAMLKELHTYSPTTNEITSFVDAMPTTVKGIVVPGPIMFWGLLTKAGIKFSSNIHPHECPLHDKGAEYAGLLAVSFTLLRKQTVEKDRVQHIVLLYKDKPFRDEERVAWQTELARLKELEKHAMEQYASALHETRKYTDLKAKYMLHLKQFEACRPILQELEKMIKPGECILYRDFVNQYMGSGGKLANLVLVVIWRNKENVPFKTIKFNNFCDDDLSRACDAYYVADVFDLYFGSKEKCCRFFKTQNITVVFLSGDHGPHFSAIMTVFNESLFFSKYKIILICLFLCSYHAFNRCDAAGVESVRLVMKEIKGRREINEAVSFSSLVNYSLYHNSYAVDFPSIRRNAVENPVFAVKLVKNDKLDLRSKCEIRYAWYNENGEVCREDGVILCRNVPVLPVKDPATGLHTLPGIGDLFDVYDLRDTPPGGALCKVCSKRVQMPVRHGTSCCPVISNQTQEYSDLRVLLTNTYLPDPDRIEGLQHGLKLAKMFNKPQGSHPCRFEFEGGTLCPKKHYQRWYTANHHMTKEHNVPQGHMWLYPAPEKPKKASKPKNPSKPKGQASAGLGPLPTGEASAGLRPLPAGEASAGLGPLLAEEASAGPGPLPAGGATAPSTSAGVRQAPLKRRKRRAPNKQRSTGSSTDSADSAHYSADENVPLAPSRVLPPPADISPQLNKDDWARVNPGQPADAYGEYLLKRVRATLCDMDEAREARSVARKKQKTDSAGHPDGEWVYPAASPEQASHVVDPAPVKRVDRPGRKCKKQMDYNEADPCDAACPPADVVDGAASPTGAGPSPANASASPADDGAASGAADVAIGQVAPPAVSGDGAVSGPADVPLKAAGLSADPPASAFLAPPTGAGPNPVEGAAPGVAVVVIGQVAPPAVSGDGAVSGSADVSLEAAGPSADPPASAVLAPPTGAGPSPVNAAAFPAVDGAGPCAVPVYINEAFPPPPAVSGDGAVSGSANVSPTVAELKDKSNIGRFVLYLATPDDVTGKVFIVVGKIRRVVWENKRLWFDTEDYVSSEDQHYPRTITDGSWISKREKKVNWLDVSPNTATCVVCVFSQLSSLPADQALRILSNSPGTLAVEFMTRVDEDRPKSKKKYRR